MRSALRTIALGVAIPAGLAFTSHLHAQAGARHAPGQEPTLHVPAQDAARHTPSEFAGTWNVTFESQMGAMTWVFRLELEDEVLSGIAQAESGTMPVDGTQRGETVAFVVQVEAPDHSVTLEFDGTVDGDTASGSVTIFDAVYEWSAERAEADD